jgi:hypothetical protein
MEFEIRKQIVYNQFENGNFQKSVFYLIDLLERIIQQQPENSALENDIRFSFNSFKLGIKKHYSIPEIDQIRDDIDTLENVEKVFKTEFDTKEIYN